MRTKTEFYQEWRRNRYGNRLRDWKTLEEARISNYSGPFNIRSVSKAASPIQTYKLSFNQLSKKYNQLIRTGTSPAEISIGEMAPDHLLTIQGEVYREPGGLYLFADQTPNLRMREALKVAKGYTGLQAKVMLETSLTPSSLDDLMELLELDAVVEFSVYSKEVGWTQGRNHLIWEVRKY